MSRFVLRGVMLGVFVVLSVPGPTSAWEPDEFEVYCGKPARESGYIVGQYALGLEKDPNTREYYLKHLGEDADVADDPGCLSPVRAGLLEDYARRSLLALKGMGFTSPSPNRLGPVVLGKNGKNVVRLFVDREYGGIANTLAPCVAGSDAVDPDRLSLMTFSTGYFENWPPPVALRLVSHEMMHLVQNAQAFRGEPHTESCAGVPEWLREGSADATSVDMVKRRFPGYRPPLTVRGSKSFYGLRPYDRAFTWVSGDAEDEHGYSIISEYRTSSLFMHLADHYYGGKYDYLAGFFAVPDGKRGGDDWLAWFDDLLRLSDDGPKAPFYLVFPDFIANYANWGTKKHSHIGESDWLADSFDGCYTETLSRDEPKTELTLELEPISAQCLKVLTRLDSGEVGQVKLMAYADSEEEIDNIHLGVAHMSAKVLDFGGNEMNCYDVAKTQRGKPVCITKPYTGRRNAGEDMGVKEQTASGSWVKTWASVMQESTGDLLDNLYVVTHTPVEPRDAKHDNRNTQKVRLEIALDAPAFSSSTHGKSKTMTASINNNLIEPVPMTGSEGTFGGLAAGGGDPQALSKLPFLMNMPSVKMPAMAQGDGISSVTLSTAEIQSDLSRGFDPDYTLQLVLVPDGQAIPFGSNGSFRASVTGYDLQAVKQAGSNPMAMVGAMMSNLSRDEPSATIEVVEWSDALLRLRVNGDYCRVSDWDRQADRCRQPQNFSGEVIKPFGWTYDTNRPFVSIDTPGMELYRKRLYESMREQMGMPRPPMPETPGQSRRFDTEVGRDHEQVQAGQEALAVSNELRHATYDSVTIGDQIDMAGSVGRPGDPRERHEVTMGPQQSVGRPSDL